MELIGGIVDAFIGRAREIAALDRMVRRMREGGRAGGRGRQY